MQLFQILKLIFLTGLGKKSNAFLHYLTVLEKMSSSIIPFRYLSNSLGPNNINSAESEESDLDENEESGEMDTSK